MSNQSASLYQSLTAEERKRFTSYLLSPLYNERKDVVRLNRLLGQFGELEDKQKWFGKVYPNSDYQDFKWRQLNSSYLSLLEDFLVHDYQDTFSKAERELALKKILRSRGQSQRVKAADRRLTKSMNILNDGARYAHCYFEVQKENIQQQIDKREVTVTAIESLRRNHERAFLLESLRLASQSLAAQSIEPGELKHPLLAILLDHFAQPDQLSADPVLALYVYCYRMLEKPDAVAAFNSFLLLLPTLDKMAADEARDLTLLAVNYCVRRVNAGNSSASITALDLYTRGLEAGYLLDQGRISRFTFSNAIAFALKGKSIERAMEFLNRFSDLLPPAYRQSTVALNRARLAYESGELDVALNELQSASDQETITTLNIKILQMRVYYQLSEFRLLDAHLDALEIYLRRRKETLGYHYRAYRQLVDFVRRFRRVNPLDRADLQAFHQRLITADAFPEREWLLAISQKK